VTPIVEFHEVSKWYGNVIGINKITLDIRPGVTGLLGPNGAGKSTLLQLATGQLRPSQGTVRVLGQNVWNHAALNRSIGLCPEQDAFYEWMTGWDFVFTCARLSGLPRATARAATERTIEAVGMTRNQGRAIRGYSKGMRQRIKIAGALVHEPAILLLDEPFNGMDPRQRLQLMELLRQMGAAGRTVLFSSHILEEVERLSGTVQVIVAGRLAASGDYRTIRRLMTSRPHVFQVASSDDRTLASALIGRPSVNGVELNPAGGLEVRAGDYGAFSRELATVAREHNVRLRTVLPADESLESVFTYLVAS